MDCFLSLLCFMGSCTSGDSLEMDIVGNLPPEMAIKILRMLDPCTLVSSALVNKRWLGIIHSDVVLRSRVREVLRKERLQRKRPLNIKCVVFRNGNRVSPFEARNDRFVVSTSSSDEGVTSMQSVAGSRDGAVRRGRNSLVKTAFRRAKDLTKRAARTMLCLPEGHEDSTADLRSRFSRCDLRVDDVASRVPKRMRI